MGVEYKPQVDEEVIGPLTSSAFFSREYAKLIARPLTLEDHSGPVVKTTDPIKLWERREALQLYLEEGYSAERIWGRTILAEIVCLGLFDQLFADTLRERRMFLVPTPTSMDDSVYEARVPYYQKGGDMVILKEVENGYPYPVLVVDVTLGNAATVNCKRKAPGIQTSLAVPVSVLPLRGLRMREVAFEQFLDGPVRNQIIKTGSLQPLAELDVEMLGELREQLRREMVMGIDECANSFHRKKGKFLDYVRDYQCRNTLAVARSIFSA